MISRATAADVAELTPLFDAYRSFFAGRQSAQESRRFLQERLSQSDSVVFSAKRNGQTVGFIQLYPLWSSWYCRRIWFLSDLYVAEASRKLGIGQRLVQRVIDYARETEAASIMVELPRGEPHLADFYGRLGFERDAIFELARFSCVTQTTGH